MKKLCALTLISSLALSSCAKEEANSAQLGRTVHPVLSSQSVHVLDISQAMAPLPQDRKPFLNAETPRQQRGVHIKLNSKNVPTQTDRDYPVRYFNELPNIKKPQVIESISAPLDKLPPQSRALIAKMPDEQIEFVITFEDTIPISGFPKLIEGDNVKAWQVKAKAFPDKLRQKRNAHYKQLIAPMKALGIEILDTHVVSNAILVRANKNIIPILESVPEITSISVRYLPIAAPTVKSGRNLSDSDPINNAVTTGYSSATNIIMIDSGVRTTHQLLNGKIASSLDCTIVPPPYASDQSCLGTSTSDITLKGHGTSSAGIMVGNTAYGDLYRGVSTRHQIVSLKTGSACPESHRGAPMLMPYTERSQKRLRIQGEPL